MRRGLLAAVLLLAGCGDDAAPEGSVEAVLGDVELVLEVADEPAERARGLMGRTEVPPGTGMVFQYDEPSRGPSFYMFNVPIDLTAVFVLDGEVVHVAQMEPCPSAEPGDCPLYGPEGAFDTVVETAPETVEDVRVGDAFTYR